jgi:hypothetical protein
MSNDFNNCQINPITNECIDNNDRYVSTEHNTFQDTLDTTQINKKCSNKKDCVKKKKMS